MASAIAANRLELLQIADAVARDKSIDKQVVLTAMEEAMQRAAKAHYGTENDIKVDIDPKTGETHVSRYLHVIELVENDKTEISLVEARKRNPDAQVGDIIAETLPAVEFNRINAQNAKQVIVQKVREAERDRQYQEFKDRIGDIVNGVVKRVEYGSVIVDLGRVAGFGDGLGVALKLRPVLGIRCTHGREVVPHPHGALVLSEVDLAGRES